MIEKNIYYNKDRARYVLLSVALSVVLSFLFSRWSHSDGRSAVGLSFVNLSLFAFYSARFQDRPMARLLAAAAVFGGIELIADFLCVRSTRTLDYAPARSAMLLESPWWMPLSWALVAVQVGELGARGIARFGLVRGAALSGLLGALLIPFYEEMAYGAHWWRYTGCWMLGHTPVYIIVAEALIGAALALLGYFALAARSLRQALGIGALAGLATILGGLVGWGLVEFIGRGARPHPLF